MSSSLSAKVRSAGNSKNDTPLITEEYRIRVTDSTPGDLGEYIVECSPEPPTVLTKCGLKSPLLRVQALGIGLDADAESEHTKRCT